jgi:hypothetical protein
MAAWTVLGGLAAAANGATAPFFLHLSSASIYCATQQALLFV